MRYLYAFIFLMGSFTMSSFTYSESAEASAFLPDLVFDTVTFHSELCGDTVLDGWAIWEGGVCLAFRYTYTSERCRTITVEGLTPPSDLFDSNGKVRIGFFEAGEGDHRME